MGTIALGSATKPDASYAPTVNSLRQNCCSLKRTKPKAIGSLDFPSSPSLNLSEACDSRQFAAGNSFPFRLD